ncbi:cell division protein ZapA [Pusillimonas sp. CC-YST705]|uniref:Cell division protein ZapA n=1 Tax=Mesopusillimonas faecipullorum TaxID=2755040 RepID=A0ABS8CBI3_9BURK|nr:cell division protein ZapA [Mesopusillimonas faecipullorum]MCB5363387.1 cell division protein ZapA [Mesopusillimonas faecipullorum]
MERVDVNILGRDYSLACEPSEKQALIDAVKFIDQRMLSIKGSGKISGNERIAVMAAIQTALELLAVKAPDGPLGGMALGDFKRKIDDMNGLLDQVMPNR